ncbi:PREDICTED: protein SYS1 homolog isoform X1 [Lupinus angustifolius]|uniref:protein SYS1 homolog isoform X1 n=1 Tax=Lupinus angustifolius TaxID=3871 RepID=UPI00092F3707|nr:PREDICTED: protein SYS1 homolog isoform X1 [Lupinus angustifolius]
MFYGAVVWDPWLIVGQIVCLQCLYYITLGMFLSLLVGTRVSRMSLVYFFDYVTITASTVTGWCVIASFLLSSIAGAVYMLYLIERAKKCLDFSATLYIIHLFICIVYGGWPSSITWWIVNGTGIAVMALLAEYLCIKRESREIPITRYRSKVTQVLNSRKELCCGMMITFSCKPWMMISKIKPMMCIVLLCH